MGFDDQWASCYPYRTIASRGTQIPLEVRIRNHLAAKADAQIDLSCPDGWKVDLSSPVDRKMKPNSGTATIKAKSDGQVEFKVTIPDKVKAGRYVITANVIFAGKDYGELAEAIIDIG